MSFLKLGPVYHLAADAESSFNLCGRVGLPAIIMGHERKHREANVCKDCLKVAVRVDNELLKAWYSVMEKQT